MSAFSRVTEIASYRDENPSGRRLEIEFETTDGTNTGELKWIDSNGNGRVDTEIDQFIQYSKGVGGGIGNEGGGRFPAPNPVTEAFSFRYRRFLEYTAQEGFPEEADAFDDYFSRLPRLEGEYSFSKPVLDCSDIAVGRASSVVHFSPDGNDSGVSLYDPALPFSAEGCATKMLDLDVEPSTGGRLISIRSGASTGSSEPSADGRSIIIRSGEYISCAVTLIIQEGSPDESLIASVRSYFDRYVKTMDPFKDAGPRGGDAVYPPGYTGPR